MQLLHKEKMPGVCLTVITKVDTHVCTYGPGRNELVGACKTVKKLK